MADLSARERLGTAVDGDRGAPSGAQEQRGDAASDGAAEALLPERDLAGALHEVSNALTVVLGWIEQARIGGVGDGLAALDIASFRARQARHIVRRAIGADVPEDLPCAVEELVRDAVIGLEPEARRVSQALVASIDPAAAGALIEQRSTALQILTNLLLNALAISPPGASVRVEVAPDSAGAVIISVSDEGPGVSPPRRATLFDGGVSTRAGGAGIGLRHAAALARAAGGELSLADSPHGARFELRWPRVGGGVGRRPSAAPPGVSGLSGARILLLEDDEAVIDLLDTALTARGATIVSAKSLSELQGALRAGPFDAALLDISPIQADLAGAFEAVRSLSPSAKLIVISGSAVAPPSFPASVSVVWVRKPFEIREIVDALAR